MENEQENPKKDDVECTVFGINPKNGNIVIQQGYNKLEIGEEDSKVLNVIITNIILK